MSTSSRRARSGAILNERSIPQIRAKVIAGAANNQLATPADGRRVLEQGLLYAPDYVINAGGIIDIHYEGPGYDEAVVHAHLQRIGLTLSEIFERSKTSGQPTGEIADVMAEAIFRR